MEQDSYIRIGTTYYKEGKDIPEEDIAIKDTYKLFGCEKL